LTPTPYHDRVTPPTKKGSDMIAVGDQFTTAKSGVKGTVAEIVKNASGSLRVRLITRDGDRWTTVQAS
jgi:hypothetical protein